MTHQVAEVAVLAGRYCELIEASGTDNATWLKDIAALLPRLHAAISSHDGQRYDRAAIFRADLDTRFELYSHLVELLGDRDAYWLEFDRVDDFNAMTGSLADDLTDIYCELKSGLRTVDQDPDYSLQAWVEGFSQHWGQHLSDATRHLSALDARGRLGQ